MVSDRSAVIAICAWAIGSTLQPLSSVLASLRQVDSFDEPQPSQVAHEECVSDCSREAEQILELCKSIAWYRLLTGALSFSLVLIVACFVGQRFQYHRRLRAARAATHHSATGMSCSIGSSSGSSGVSSGSPSIPAAPMGAATSCRRCGLFLRAAGQGQTVRRTHVEEALLHAHYPGTSASSGDIGGGSTARSGADPGADPENHVSGSPAHKCLLLQDVRDQLQGSAKDDATKPLLQTLPSLGASSINDAALRESYQEKFVFFVRHAQSDWNRHLNDLKKGEQILNDPMQAAPALQGAFALAGEISQGLLQDGHTDHKLSELGQSQALHLHDLLAHERRSLVVGVSSGSSIAAPERPVFYEQFFSGSPSVFCSPLLRAVQTAHLALPMEAGWGDLVLVKDAREVFSNWAERDCIGGAEGRGLIERATRECDLPGLSERIDWSRSDCDEGRWWSDCIEGEDAVNERLDALVKRLLDEDGSRSCICVTHSNLIRRLMMRYGAVGDSEVRAEVETGPSLSADTQNVGVGTNSRACPFGVGGTVGIAETMAEVEETDTAGNAAAAGQLPLLGSSFCSDMSWERLNHTPIDLQRCKVEKLQNCGMIGVRFVKELKGRWVAHDVCMMFGSKLESDLQKTEG